MTLTLILILILIPILIPIPILILTLILTLTTDPNPNSKPNQVGQRLPALPCLSSSSPVRLGGSNRAKSDQTVEPLSSSRTVSPNWPEVASQLLVYAAAANVRLVKTHREARARHLPIADMRVTRSSEMVKGIRVLKYNGWDTSFEEVSPSASPSSLITSITDRPSAPRRVSWL